MRTSGRLVWQSDSENDISHPLRSRLADADQWVPHSISLDGPMIGKTISYFFVGNFQGSPDGAFDIKIADITITHADGTITPIPTPLGSFNYGGDMTDVTNVSFAGERPGVVADAHLYLGDHLGSTVVEFSGGNWPVWKGEYTPFGQELDTQYVVNNYKFAGMEHDPESGLDHTQFRQYASVTGRWLSPDPYSGSYDLSNPQSFNRYSYVGNMPLGFTDPSGLLANGEYCGNACKKPGIGDEIGKAVIGGGIGYLIYKGISSLVGMFDTPNCNSCDHPRPDIGNGQWDGNFGESLGLPVNGPQLGGGGVGGFFGIPSGCEFGACGNSYGPWRSGAYPNGNNPQDLNLFGGFLGSLKELIFGKHPSAVCVQEATQFAEKYDAASGKVPYGKVSETIDILRAKNLMELTSAFYNGYAGDKALSDAAYASVLRKCVSEGR